MSIFISILRFEPGKTLGSEVYLRSFLSALQNVAKDKQITIAASEKGFEWGKVYAPNFEWVKQKVSDSIVRRMISETKQIENLARVHNAKVIFFPFNIMPKVKVPSVLLVHDLVNEFYSSRFPLYRPIYYQTVKTLVRKSIRRADNLLTVSHTIAEELKKSKLLLPSQKVFAAPLASQPINNKKRPTGLKIQGEKIILQTGDHLPHKNHITGIKAINFLTRTYPDFAEKIHLVLTGGFIRNEKLKKYVSENNLENKVSFLGKVTDEELEWLMQNSELICFPTLYEGFCLGVIESQKRKKPLLLSDIPVLREVSANRAIFFEPENYTELGEKIKNIIETNSYNKVFIDKGIQNASSRTWESHAEKVIEVLEFTSIK